MENEKTINEQINEIIERQYNGYRGRQWRSIHFSHWLLRGQVGDYVFLAFLEKQERDNPKPIFKQLDSIDTK